MKQIETLHLFPKLTEELLKLLQGLEISDWLKPSPINGRTVKDLVSHIIDGSLRNLSIQRDNFVDDSNVPNINSYKDLVEHIQKLNKDWMIVSRRLSPTILIDLLEYSDKQFYDFLKSKNPNDKAIFAVAWAGETESENWFDIAREYTEKWHHQMQIRLALDKPILLDTEYSEPLYDTFMFALPYLYRDFTNYDNGTKIKTSLTGKLRKDWVIERQTDKWDFIDLGSSDIHTSVEIPDDIAWIIFTNTDRDKEKYKTKIKIIGDNSIGLKLLDLVTVMS
ncbi:MAG: maleylpyruvate isomerase N-terminal domain-containing protein [candidate division KSB1 bacterium]|nr:maleylpyruvate isomerase N-terminal domain-containing protein [candidate division KSB1 bacterium]